MAVAIDRLRAVVLPDGRDAGPRAFEIQADAGSDEALFRRARQGFDTVLIDEAAQAVEMSTLIPLKHACRRLILVGDHRQLAPVVTSYNAAAEAALSFRRKSRRASCS